MTDPSRPERSPEGRPWWTERRDSGAPMSAPVPGGVDPEAAAWSAAGAAQPRAAVAPESTAPTSAGRYRQPTPPTKRRGPVIVTVVGAVLVAAIVVAMAPWDADRRQAVADQVAVWITPPSERAEEIADTLQLTDEGRRIFFATQPQIEAADNFNANCELEGQTVLGCYSGDRIHVFEVTDERLAGTVEVTAAHEMLHAAYERLSGADRDDIDALMAEAIAGIPDGDETREILEAYPESQQLDEWHSRLGTEITDLPAGLEAHYARYFADRSVILEIERASTAALDEVTSEIDTLVARIDRLGADLETRGDAYDRDLEQLNQDIAAFNDRAEAGDFDSLMEAEAERQALVARSDALESERISLNADTERYNGFVRELQALDARYADLYSSLDSSVAPDDVEN